MSPPEHKPGYWWVRYTGEWEVAHLVLGEGGTWWVFFTATEYEQRADEVREWGAYLGTAPGDAPLRKLLSRVLDLCRSLMRFGPGGAAGAGMLEGLNKLAEEARSL